MTSPYINPSAAWKNVIPLQKFGRLPDIDAAGGGEDVWDAEGAYSFPAAATTMTVSSSSTDDDVAGTGALTVRVMGLDEDWNETTEDITLTGQTEVAIGTDLIRVYRAYVLTAGTGEVNAGDIWIGSGTVTDGVPANKYAGILAGNGQTLMAIYTVPVTMADGTATDGGRLVRWYATCGAGQSAYASLALQTRSFGGAWRTRRVMSTGEGGWPEDRPTFGIDLDPKTDIRVRVLNNGVTNTSIEAGFDIAIRK